MTTKLKKNVFLFGVFFILFMSFVLNLRAQSNPKFKVIAFYNASYDVAHISFAHEANYWFPQLAEKYNFQYDSTKNWDNLNANFLSQYQVVLFLDDRPTSASQRAAFQQYMQNGGGFIGFHVSAFNTNPSEWDWYHNQFLATGAFKTNTWGPTTAILKVEDKTHPATAGMPDKFTSAVSEWYGWDKDLRTNPNIKILCSVDPASFPLGSDPNQSWYSGYYPIVWTNKNYKMLYCNFGHNDIDYSHNNADKSRTFSNPTQNNIVINTLLNFGGGTAPVFAIPGTVQAEGYDSMNGVKKETTTDAGGGQNIGYIDAGDWLDYKVNVATSGSYTVQYRVASMNGGGSIQLKSGTNILATSTIPSTSGWQTWTTVSAAINLSAGTQTLRLQAATGGFNINWTKFIADGNQNQSPTISLISPTANAEFTAPATIAIAATASDADGSISKVEFFNGSTLVGTSTNSPYSFNWNNVAAGVYSITAKATDNLGATSVSSAIIINVKSASPTCIPASASSDDGNVPTNVLDNNLSTRWSANGDGQWIQFCLDTVKSVYGLQIASYNGNARQSIFDIQLSVDASSWTNALTNVRSSGTTLNLETFNFTSQPAKYVRILGHGNSVSTWNSFTEVKILSGTPPENQAPTVSISSPVSNASYFAPAAITINVNAADVDGLVSKVEFFHDSIKIGEDVTSPFSFSWANVVEGNYSITAKATDNTGASTTSSEVIILVKPTPVNKAPEVSITSPSANASFTAPASITISATATDNDGSITKVEFFNGSTKLGEDATSPYSISWTNVSAGTYSITAKATDNNGASATSSSISFTVKANTNACSGLATYKENGGYAAGSKVQNAGGIYQCKPYPYSGWCNGSAWAYAPGTGSYWTDAWDKVGTCAAKMGEVNDINSKEAISILPNPTSQTSIVKLNVADVHSAEYSVINSLGVEVSKGKLNSSLEGTIDLSEMQSGIYTVRISANGNVWMNKIIKQ